MLLALATASLLAASPKVGEIAPDFEAKDVDGQTVKLSALVEKGPVVLAFVPAAFTKGCTKEMENYRDRFGELVAQNATVLVVSMDAPAKVLKWRQELKAPQTFIPDPDGAIVKRYDTKMPVVSYSKRVTFVLGKGREVLAVDEGSDAIDPAGAVRACSLKPAAGTSK